MNAFFREHKAQAALVDSLFFIAIISALGTGLFYFAINYGLSSEELLNSFYSSDFTTDALKVITYVNITRDGEIVKANRVVNSTDEFDYLFAMIKEDYAENSKKEVKITLPTQKNIAKTLYEVLKPFDSSFDYAFFISKEGGVQGEQNFLVMILALHKYQPEESDPLKMVTREYYSCRPKFSNVIEKYIYPSVGSLDSSFGRISLCENSGTCSSFLIGINIWVSKSVEIFNKINEGDDTEFVCTKLEGIVKEGN